MVEILIFIGYNGRTKLSDLRSFNTFLLFFVRVWVFFKGMKGVIYEKNQYVVAVAAHFYGSDSCIYVL